MLIFWVQILFLVTTRVGLHALMLKNSSVFSNSRLQEPVLFSDFCLCLRHSVSAPAPPLQAYSALIGQFKDTPSM